MRFLVTGTAGFIGFHVARRLLDEGHFVVGFDAMTDYYDVRLKEARHAVLGRSNGFKAVIGRLEDTGSLARAADLAEPEVVIHLAAQAGVRYSLENPRAYVDSNLVGSFNILDLARTLRPAHLLLASTSSIYGAAEQIPFRETDRADQPLTLYAASKKAMEEMAHAYAHLHKIPTTAFRFFTVYGPWGRPDMALFKFVRGVLDGTPIDVYGDGTMERDFTYIDDLVEAILRLVPIIPGEANRVSGPGVADTLSRVAPFRVVNIGGGQPVSLTDFIEIVERTIGRPAIRNSMPMQAGDVPRTFAAPDLLQALTGFQPSVPLDEGVRRFVTWYKEFYGNPA